jgi:hypothetical protein
MEDDSYYKSKSDFNLNIQNQELIKFLDDNIETEYRENYLKLKHGVKVPKQQLNKLRKHITHLMENKEWNPQTFHEKEDN